ncbi:hypothetical protein B5E58_12150 [Tyzzerella sp. An114]|nr:hypothetical protein B5E58_12150 [Tyzzerella sp. An114]
MGTSSIFNGRNDRNPLLPEDYESTQEEQKISSEPVKWQTVKSDMSKYIKSGGTYSSIKHIARQYVRAAGGSSRMASHSYSGKKVGANIGSFFNGVVNNGIESTFKSLGIQYVGKSVGEIFSRLVDVIAPNSNTKEDIVAKEATQMALSRIYDYVEANEMDIKCINNMPPELMNGVLKEYVGSYIWITMMNDLGSRLEMYISNSEDAYATECEFKDMIMGIVDVEFDKQGDIINQDVHSTMNSLYERCLGVLEGIV